MTTSGSGDGPPIAPGRSCGKCSMCCKLLHVIELDKPANKWCEHCRPGAGCQIYETRPHICRSFACGWLMSAEVGDEWFPLLSHMILSMGVFNGVQTVTVTVDPRFPWAWREYPYYQQLKLMAHRGLHVGRPEDILIVHVRCDRNVWLVLPNEDAEISTGSYIVKCVGSGEWAVEQFASPAEAATRVAELLHH